MSVCALKLWRLCGQFDTDIPDILPKLEWKDQPVIYTKGRWSCTKARGREEIKVLKQNKLSLSDWGFFSFQDTFKILISSKNLTLRILILKKKRNPQFKKLQYSSLVCLFDFLNHFLSFTFSGAKYKDWEREKEKRSSSHKESCANAGKVFSINKVFMLYAKAVNIKTFLKIIFLPSLIHKP